MFKKGSFEKKSNLTILLASLLVSFVFTLNFSKHGCNEGEQEEAYFALRIIHVFVHGC